jgi:hypothetical protein
MTARRGPLHAVTDVAAELAAIMAEPASVAAVAVNAAEGAPAVAAGPMTVRDQARAIIDRIEWTAADVYHVGTQVDGYGRVTVTLRRGALVEHVKVRIVQTDEQIVAAALRQANGRTS